MGEELKWISTTNMLVVHEGKVLVLKRGDNKKDFPGWFMLPGGKQEYFETPLQAAIRETFEETGIKVSDPKLRVLATHNHEYRGRVYIVYIFMATEFTGELVQSDEGESLWVLLEDLMNDPKLYPDLKRHIKLINSSPEGEVLFTYHKFDNTLKIVEKF